MGPRYVARPSWFRRRPSDSARCPRDDVEFVAICGTCGPEVGRAAKRIHTWSSRNTSAARLPSGGCNARAPVSLAAARALQPPEGSRAAEVFRDDHVWIRFAARPTSGPQVPHDRDEFYIVASGTARYRWDGGETMIGPGDMMFAAAHTPHGYDQFSEDFSVWVVFYGPPR